MALKHWITAGLLGATGTFQRAAREYAEEYAVMAVAAERERWAQAAAVAVQELAGCATWTQGGVTCQALRNLLGNA